MSDIRAIRVLCPICDISLSIPIDGGDERSMRIPDGAIAAGIREHVDSAHPDERHATARPEVGETVHYLWTEGCGRPNCFPARVGGIQTDGKLNLDMPFGAPGPAFIDGADEDPSARTASTWHLPCDKAGATPAEPEPDVLPTTVVIHVHGVLTERQLGDAIEKHLVRAGMVSPFRNSPYWRR